MARVTRARARNRNRGNDIRMVTKRADMVDQTRPQAGQRGERPVAVGWFVNRVSRLLMTSIIVAFTNQLLFDYDYEHEHDSPR
jgi:hypothetical protein